MSGNKISSRASSPRPSVSLSGVLLTAATATLLSWLLPLLLGKYADTSFPRIGSDDMLYELLTVDELRGIMKGEKLPLHYTDGKRPPDSALRNFLQKSSSKESANLPLCPAVSPHLVGLQLGAGDSAASKVWSPEAITKWANKRGIQPGGIWEPSDCRARYAVTVIVGERNRTEQLQRFLMHMHPLLARQQLRYRLVVVQQDNSLPYNRGKLFNIGFAEAVSRSAVGPEQHCVILHDVDLLPLSDFNLYACTRQPRHLTVAVDTFRFQLPYRSLCGGAIALQSLQYRAINGFSNSFSGWGGEDDDFCSRLEARGLSITRFSPDIGVYHMLSHTPAAPAADRFDILQQGPDHRGQDGLSTLLYHLDPDAEHQQPLMTLLRARW